MKSLMGRPKTHMAGERCVSRSGVLRYWSMALWNWSVFKDPSVAVLSVMSRLTVFTPTSARQLLCGNATDDRRWFTPQLAKNVVVLRDVQSCLHYTLRGINYTFEGWITHYTSRVVDYTFRCTQTTHFIFIEFSIMVSKLVKKQRMVTNF